MAETPPHSFCDKSAGSSSLFLCGILSKQNHPVFISGEARGECSPLRVWLLSLSLEGLDERPPHSRSDCFLIFTLFLFPIVLQRIFLPPQDPGLGIIALHHTATPWEISLTPRTRMWVDEFGYDLGKYGFCYVLPYYYDASWSKGRMWHRSKGKIKGKESIAYRQEPGQPEPQGMRAPRPGIPVSRCVHLTSVVRSALSTVVPTVDLLPSPLLALR